jgi:hypothetical protein
MRRPLLVALILAIAAIALLWAVFVRQVDDGFVVVTATRVLDPLGETKLAYTRGTRDCSNVRGLISHGIDVPVQAALAAETPGIGRIYPRAAWTSDDWLLVEADVENREPVIALLKGQSGGYVLVAQYSGTAAPFNETQSIHEYLIGKAPSAVHQLVRCFEPAGPPFR